MNTDKFWNRRYYLLFIGLVTIAAPIESHFDFSHVEVIFIALGLSMVTEFVVQIQKRKERLAETRNIFMAYNETKPLPKEKP